MTKRKSAAIFILLIVSFYSVITPGQSAAEDNELVNLLKEGIENFNLNNSGATRIAFEKFTTALEKCRKKQITECEVLALNYLGQISLRENENEKAAENLRQAFELFQLIKGNSGLDNLEHQILLGLGTANLYSGNSDEALVYFKELQILVSKRNDRSGQATVLAYLGNVYQSLKQPAQALEKYVEALRIFQSEKSKFPNEAVFQQWEFAVLSSIAGLHQEYGEISQSLEYNRKILEIQKNRGELANAAITLNNMHMIAAPAGRSEEALKYLDEALAICKTLDDKNLEAFILGFAVSTNFAEGELVKAVEFAERVLKINQAQNDIPGQARSLAIIGGIFLNLGNYFEAVNYYQRALPLYQSQTCRNSERKFSSQSNFCRQGETAVVTGLGKAYNSLGKKEEALRILENELVKTEAESQSNQSADDQYKGLLLNLIGQIYFESNQNEKAIKYYTKALPLINGKNFRRQSVIITDIGKVQANLENRAEAVSSYSRALLMLKPFVKNLKKGNEEAAGYTLSSLMLLYKFENPKAAVFFGKKAVDAYQTNRENITKLDKETQKLYLKSVEFTYRTLAELLLMQQRVEEAQQVINSFKDQQFFDPEQKNPKNPMRINLLTQTPREKEFIVVYEKLSEEIGSIEKQIEELKRKTSKGQPRDEEIRRLRKLESDLRENSEKFAAVLKQAETEFAKPADEKDKVGEVPDLKEMQSALRELNEQTGQKAVAVYQLVGAENFSALLITPNNIEKVSSAIKGAELNEKALKLWALLQSPKYDTTVLSKEIYNAVFRPLEEKLPKDTTTILWSLDGNLRYVPMATLFDGKRFLVERYDHAVFTRADRERMTRAVSPVWTGTGFGSSESATVDVLGDKISFGALPGVSEELAAIFKNPKGGILDGKTFPDREFNKANFLAALKTRRPLVHIASHFSFRPGDEARSFLLMGDGTAFTLEEMKREANLFQGVELLTLSACNTAAQQAGANGREIDGFAELAQRLGAGAVMATLWQVSDASTPWLMREFYANRQNKGGTTKASALQKAQIALLKGTAETKPLPEAEKGAGSKLQIVLTEDGKRDSNDTRADIIYVGKRDAPLYDKTGKPPFAHPFYWSPFILIGNWR